MEPNGRVTYVIKDKTKYYNSNRNHIPWKHKGIPLFDDAGSAGNDLLQEWLNAECFHDEKKRKVNDEV